MPSDATGWVALIGGVIALPAAFLALYRLIIQPLEVTTYVRMVDGHEFVGVTVKNRSYRTITIEDAQYEFVGLSEMALAVQTYTESGGVGDDLLEDVDIAPGRRVHGVIDTAYDPGFFDPNMDGDPALKDKLRQVKQAFVSISPTMGRPACSKPDEVFDLSDWLKPDTLRKRRPSGKA